MKVFINGRFLTQQTTGVQQFAREICRYLSTDEIHFTLLIPQDTVIPSWLNHIPVKIVGKRNGYWWEQVELPLYLTKQGSPLLINFCNTAPLFYANQIVTIHDLAFIYHPEWFSKSFATIYRFLIPRIAKRAKKIITVSQTVKQQLIKTLKPDAKRIDVLYNGVSHDLLQANKNETPRENIFFTVSSLNPRKNLHTLIDAFIKANIPGYKLLVAGASNKVFAQQQLDNLPDNIQLLGYVSNEELIQLYNKSQLFISLSHDEGFGIPVLEALYMSCPVLLSDIDVYTECFSGVATFISPNSAETVATALQAFAEEKTTHSIDKQQLSVLLEKYDYHESARQFIKLLKKM